MSVTRERLEELESLLHAWSVKRSTTKTELQSLVGKLSFVSKCVQQSRLFLARILTLLRTLKRNSYHTRLTGEFRKDIAWWLRFMRSYNGVSFISSLSWTAPDSVFSTDACLSGCGGLSTFQYFHAMFPPEVLTAYAQFHLLKALAILVAVCLWGHLWSGLRIQVRKHMKTRLIATNAPVVSALSSGKVKNHLLTGILREIWFVTASLEFELCAVHLSGEENRAADLLSRWHLDRVFEEPFRHLPSFPELTEVIVPPDFFNLHDY